MELTIKVTQEHINKGMARSCVRCPVALAVQEASGRDAEVYKWIFILYGGGGVDFRADTPEDVFAKINKFDKDGIMEPFEFNVTLVKEEGIRC